MSELKVDEGYLNDLQDNLREVIKALIIDCEDLTDGKKDIFERYMAMNRTISFLAAYKITTAISKTSLKLGFDMTQPELQTKSAIENGWGERDIERNVFFIQTEESTEKAFEKFSSMMDKKIKDILGDCLKEEGDKKAH